MLTELLNGLQLIKTYNTDAPVVTHAYLVCVPKVLVADMSSAHQSLMDGWGWKSHPLYKCYYYPVETITEVANVTGEKAKELPPFPIPIPPPPIPPGG